MCKVDGDTVSFTKDGFGLIDADVTLVTDDSFSMDVSANNAANNAANGADQGVDQGADQGARWEDQGRALRQAMASAHAQLSVLGELAPRTFVPSKTVPTLQTLVAEINRVKGLIDIRAFPPPTAPAGDGVDGVDGEREAAFARRAEEVSFEIAVLVGKVCETDTRTISRVCVCVRCVMLYTKCVCVCLCVCVFTAV